MTPMFFFIKVSRCLQQSTESVCESNKRIISVLHRTPIFRKATLIVNSFNGQIETPPHKNVNENVYRPMAFRLED